MGGCEARGGLGKGGRTGERGTGRGSEGQPGGTRDGPGERGGAGGGMYGRV